MRASAAACLLCAFVLSGCVRSAVIQTPTGGHPGLLTGPFVVLGVSRDVAQTGNRPNAKNIFEQVLTIEVPVGTEAIVPIISESALAYGKLEPEFVDPDDLNAEQTWTVDDHHLSIVRSDVTVLDIDAPNTAATPPSQTATIRIRMWLRDRNGNARWFGHLTYHLLFLGRAPRQ